MDQPTTTTPAPMAPKTPLIAPWLLITFIIVLLAGGGYLGWWYSNYKTPAPTTTPTPTVTTPTTTPTKTTTPTTATTDITCTNSTYGFTYVRPASWGACKTKDAALTGMTMAYYIEIATTDANFAKGDSTADAGYYSPFAISVYTLAQWTAAEASEGPKDTLITKNATYAFAWSHANGIPATDFKGESDIAGIIASFKLK